jgi:hypothetical protein
LNSAIFTLTLALHTLQTMPTLRALLQAAGVTEPSLDKLSAEFNLDDERIHQSSPFLGIGGAEMDLLGIQDREEREKIKRVIKGLKEGEKPSKPRKKLGISHTRYCSIGRALVGQPSWYAPWGREQDLAVLMLWVPQLHHSGHHDLLPCTYRPAVSLTCHQGLSLKYHHNHHH